MLMSDDFFGGGGDESQETESEENSQQEEVQTFRVGETEYSQEDIAEMAGLKEKFAEIEKNYGGLDKLTSEFGRRGQELGHLRAKVQEFEQRQTQSRAQAGEELSPQEQAQQIVGALEQVGGITQNNVRQYVNEVLEARDLVSELRGLEDDIDGSDGRPAFKAQEILNYMQNGGPSSPQAAYKLKYEAELDKWKEGQIKGNRSQGLETEEGSEAGSSKKPPEIKANKDNLHKLVSEALSGAI